MKVAGSVVPAFPTGEDDRDRAGRASACGDTDVGGGVAGRGGAGRQHRGALGEGCLRRVGRDVSAQDQGTRRQRGQDGERCEGEPGTKRLRHNDLDATPAGNGCRPAGQSYTGRGAGLASAVRPDPEAHTTMSGRRRAGSAATVRSFSGTWSFPTVPPWSTRPCPSNCMRTQLGALRDCLGIVTASGQVWTGVRRAGRPFAPSGTDFGSRVRHISGLGSIGDTSFYPACSSPAARRSSADPRRAARGRTRAPHRQGGAAGEPAGRVSAPGSPRFAGIVGYDDTVLPELERALLAGHDMVLLGERGQGKTRLIRSLVGAARRVDAGDRRLRAQRAPVRPGRARRRCGGPPSSATTCRRLAAPRRCATARSSPRPDTSVGDLIGDVDPIRVAQGRTLGDPDTIHFGLVPRTNRGIFAVNELPDLAERIQVALLNVLEERDIQVRGYQLRLPLDLLLVASANPEDYTNRGRIITPAEGPLRRRDPHPLPARARARDRAGAPGGRPRRRGARPRARGRRPVHPRACASRPPIDPRSGRLGAVRDRRGRDRRGVGAAPGRPASARPSRSRASATPCPVTSTLRGKVEFESGEEGRETEVLAHLLRTATAETFRAQPGRRSTCPASPTWSPRARRSRPASWCASAEVLRAGRHGAGPGQGARPARPRRRADARPGGRGRRDGARGPAPDPAARQGRRPTTAARSTAADGRSR